MDQDADDLLPPQRDYARLNQALLTAQRVMAESGQIVRALREAIVLVDAGLHADKALLLYVETPDPMDLRIIYSRGLTSEQAEALRTRVEGSPGVSPTVIGEAIRTRRTVWVRGSGDALAQMTASLAHSTNSVLCAPIIEPSSGSVLAVVYLQKKQALAAFDDDDHVWLTTFATAVAWGFGEFLARARQG